MIRDRNPIVLVHVSIWTDACAWPDATFQSQSFDHVDYRRCSWKTREQHDRQVINSLTKVKCSKMIILLFIGLYTYMLLSVKTSCSKEGWNTCWAMNIQLNRQRAFLVKKKTMVNTIKSSSTAMSFYDGWHELYKRSEVKTTYINDTERALMSVHQIQKWGNVLSCDSSKQIRFNLLQYNGDQCLTCNTCQDTCTMTTHKAV